MNWKFEIVVAFDQLSSQMQIFIKTLTGRRSNFNFEPENTVRQVKEALQEKEGIQVEQIRLIYSGKQMYVFTQSFKSHVIGAMTSNCRNIKSNVCLKQCTASSLCSREYYTHGLATSRRLINRLSY